MKVEFLIENIEGALSILGKILPVHSQIPVLSNILLEAGKDGFFVSATNLELGARIKIPAKIEEEGATTVPGRQFVETLSSFPKDKAVITQDKESLILTSRDAKVVFQTIAREEFPTIFEEKGEKVHEFSQEDLKNIFSSLIFAASLDESRPELTGVLLSQKDNGVDFVATDGFRLSLKRIEGEKVLEEDSSLILPARVISEAMNIKSDKVTLYVYEKSNQVILEAEDVILVGHVINGEFPNYERVIPSSSKTKITVDKDDLSQKIKLSSIFARDSANIVKFKVEGGKVRMFSKSSGLGEGEVAVEGEQEGEDNEVAFNVKFVSDLLKNISSKTVVIELSSPVEPGVFKTEDEGYTHIIMPVRMQD